MSFDFDVVDNSAQDELAISFPAVQWVHGDSKLKKVGGVMHTGGFFFPYEQAGDNTEILHWQPAVRTTQNGKDIEGIGAHRAAITIVRYRRRWFKEVQGRKEFRPWNRYETGFRGQMQAVGFIKGHSSPVTFTWKGMSIQNVNAIVQEHARKVVAEANKQAPEGKRLPLYAFYMFVEAGKPEMVGSGNDQSSATLPVIALPQQVEPEKFYVGKERLLESQKLFHELTDWVKQWEKVEHVDELEARRAESAAAVASQAPPAWMDDAPQAQPPDEDWDNQF